MSTQAPTLDEIRRRGLEALLKELGPAGMARFLRQYERGEGDTTAERDAWQEGARVSDIAERIRARKAGG